MTYIYLLLSLISSGIWVILLTSHCQAFKYRFKSCAPNSCGYTTIFNLRKANACIILTFKSLNHDLNFTFSDTVVLLIMELHIWFSNSLPCIKVFSLKALINLKHNIKISSVVIYMIEYYLQYYLINLHASFYFYKLHLSCAFSPSSSSFTCVLSYHVLINIFLFCDLSHS